MSFSFDFISKQSDADAIVAKEHAPDSIKQFVAQALTAFKPDSFVRVKAAGHLYANDYNVSTAAITVEQINLKTP